MDKQQVVVVLGAVRNEAGDLLLARRIDTGIPEAFGKWELPGGKLEFGEDPETALLREVREECGLEVKIIRLLPKVFTRIWQTSTGQELQVVLLTYECSVLSGTLSNKHVQDEIGELRFVPISELKSISLLPNISETIAYL